MNRESFDLLSILRRMPSQAGLGPSVRMGQCRNHCDYHFYSQQVFFSAKAGLVLEGEQRPL